jgi:hypothetical protein
MLNAILQRVIDIRNDLKIKSGRELCRRIDFNYDTYSNFKKRNTPPSIEFLNALKCSFEQYDINWVLTGNGSMLKSDEKTVVLVEGVNGKQKKLIPFYDINAEAGTMQRSNMDASARPDDFVDAGDWFLDADSAMRVHGDSMFPVYKSGSIIVMREVHNKQLIVFGQDYMIQTSEYRVIKRLQKSGITGCWLACSINEEIWEKGELAGRLVHEPFDISIDSVTNLFRVLGCVTRNEGSRIVPTKKAD